MVEQVRGRAVMPLPPPRAKQDRVALPDRTGLLSERRLEMSGLDLVFLRKAAKVQDVTGRDEPIEGHLVDLASLRLEMERRIDVRSGVAQHEHGFREEPVDLPRGPLGERRRRIRGEHLRARPDRLGQIDDPRESDGPRLRGHGAYSSSRGGGSAKVLAVFHRAHAFATRRNAASTVSSDCLERVTSEIVACRKCPRLVRYREQVALTKRAAFRDWEYWGRPVPGFGDPDARVLVVGLAPAAHGGNRTGRTFTGDRSGEWLYRALYRAGFSNQPTSVSKDDGLVLRDCYIAAAVRCAPPQNKPTRIEFARCQPYLEREAMLLPNLRVVVALGGVAMAAFLRAWRSTGHAVPTPAPKFRHGAISSLSRITLIASYHPSQRNTQTGLLKEAMFDNVFRSARYILEKASDSERPLSVG